MTPTKDELLKMAQAAGLEEEFLVDPLSEQRFRVFSQIAAQARSAPTVQEPVAWVTVEDGKCISTRSADFRHIADGQYQLYVGPLAYEVPAAIKTLEALGYVYEGGEQWAAPTAQPAPVPLTPEQRKNLWVSATIELPSQENCYYRGIADSEAYHGITAAPEKGQQ